MVFYILFGGLRALFGEAKSTKAPPWAVATELNQQILMSVAKLIFWLGIR